MDRVLLVSYEMGITGLGQFKGRTAAGTGRLRIVILAEQS